MGQLKHALRQLVLRPSLSIVVILMLALGIGATTAMLSLYHQTSRRSGGSLAPATTRSSAKRP